MSTWDLKTPKAEGFLAGYVEDVDRSPPPVNEYELGSERRRQWHMGYSAGRNLKRAHHAELTGFMERMNAPEKGTKA